MTDKGLAIIVGYGPGIGHAVAEALVREGHALALIARDTKKLDAAVAAFSGSNQPVRAFSADAGDARSLSAAIGLAQRDLGDAHVLHYNAAIWRPGPVLGTDPETFNTDIRIGVTGALVAAQAVAPAMMERGRGIMLFTGGGLAVHPSPEAPSLSVSKSGIRALALMLAQELAPKGIRVGTVTIAGRVAPGTPFAPDAIADAFMSLYRSTPDAATAEILFRG